MEFVHKLEESDTIVAIATPPGEGAIAIVRLSGKEAIAIASKITSNSILNYKSHTAHFVSVKDFITKEAIDDALLLIMRAPNSYTGEDIVEIQCHGGRVLAKRILESLAASGARAAKGGEFTFRAFLNGKLDLAQAEAVQQLISAKSRQAALSAKDQLEGKLSTLITNFEKELIDIAAILEAWVDFPEEDLEFAPMDEIIKQLEKIREKILHLSATFNQGRLLFEGARICIAGAPNVGKSSLMNLLCKKERSIVTPIAGTTRDFIEEIIEMNNHHFKLIDTAGIRETKEIIEQEGVERSKKMIEIADLVILILDATRELQEEEKKLLAELLRKELIVVWNKIDLVKKEQDAKGGRTELAPFLSISADCDGLKEVEVTSKTGVQNQLDKHPTLSISAKSGENVEQLLSVIEKKLSSCRANDEVIITKIRHKEALDKSALFLEKVIYGLKEKRSAEFVNLDLRSSLSELGTIIGINITEDILSAIFSKFCIGK